MIGDKPIESNMEPSSELVPELVPVSDVDDVSDETEDTKVKSKISIFSQRAVTGVLDSHSESRDLHVSQVNNNNNNNNTYLFIRALRSQSLLFEKY